MVCKVEIELKVALEKGNFNILLCCGIGSKFVLPDKYVSIHNSNIGHELTSGPLHLSLECPSVSVDHGSHLQEAFPKHPSPYLVPVWTLSSTALV